MYSNCTVQRTNKKFNFLNFLLKKSKSYVPEHLTNLRNEKSDIKTIHFFQTPKSTHLSKITTYSKVTIS